MSEKLLASVLALIIGFSLTSCTTTNTPPAAPDSKNTEKAAPDNNPAVSPTAEENSAALSGNLEVWSSGEELNRFVEGFNKIYPNITVNITVVPNSDFIAKLTPTLANGQGAPDIFTGESDYVKYLVESGFWDNLRAAPYQAETADVWDYIISVGTDSGNTLRALSWQASPGSIMYRRDMAEEVLGTDDPEKVGAMLSSNAAMLEIAAKLKEKNIKMFASWQDIMNMQLSNRKQPWINDDIVNIGLHFFLKNIRPYAASCSEA